MPLQQTSGNSTTDAYGGGAAAVVPNYIEDVFSTWLYTGNGATQTITNGIDLAGKGGLVWVKDRTTTGNYNLLFDTARGVSGGYLTSNTPSAQTGTFFLSSFNSNGFSGSGGADFNQSGDAFASWTFRKQPKFFDVVTYTGTGSATTIAHSLGSVPGCIIVKRTDTTGAWQVYHSSLANTQYTVLNTTAAVATGATRWNSTTPTSSVFSVGTDATVNASGGTYVAYVFASNAGGFGATGTDNVVSCGSYSGTSAVGNFISLGYEPQWVLIKSATDLNNWYLFDSMRGMSQTNSQYLAADMAIAEGGGLILVVPAATGFYMNTAGGLNATGTDYIYIAIRRGPMKVPTDAIKVFSPVAYTTYTNTSVTTGFPVDLLLDRVLASSNTSDFDRLRGSSAPSSVYVNTNQQNAEATTTSGGIGIDSNTQFVDNYWNNNTAAISWSFKRAPGFFDMVCYTGTGANTTVTHNLSVAPELMFVKRRSSSGPWATYLTLIGATNGLQLQSTAAIASQPNFWNSTNPTSSNFTVGTDTATNSSGYTFVAYLFATLVNISKVGSYTGNGTGQNIACGFTSGARFVLIKRTDAVGNWYVFDSANGLTSTSSPYLLLNTTGAQVTGNNGVYASTGGFTLGATAITTTNISTATYIFLAIA